MDRNIEIKACIESVESLEPSVRKIATSGPVEIVQDDIFFHSRSGRLKLRIFSENHGELIFYRRADMAGPKECLYVRSRASEPATLRQALSLACSETGRVRKRRILYLVGRTRIHLDTVERLGHFLELEVVLSDTEPAEAGREEARRIMARLGIASFQFVDRAYVDLLQQQPDPTRQFG